MLESILDEYRANILFFCFFLSDLYLTYTGYFINIAFSGLECSQHTIHDSRSKEKYSPSG